MSLLFTNATSSATPSGPALARPLVEIKDLTVKFVSRDATVQAVNGVSFEMMPGEVLCIIGESGSGKSVTMHALMQLLPKRRAVLSGHVRVGDYDIRALSARQMSDVRGSTISMVFQEPMTALDAIVQIHALMLLRTLHRDVGRGLAFVAHDLGAAAQIADRVAGMYAGRIVQYGAVRDVLMRRQHPYTHGMLAPTVHGQ